MLRRLLLTVSILAIPVSAFAQTQFFRVEVENIARVYPYLASGSFTTPVDAANPGPAGPGGRFEFSFDAPPGTSLSFATMFAQSNDWFYAPGESGISLWDGSNPVSGDVTGQVHLWNAGTEVDEEPGAGANQAPRQPDPDTGPAENGTVEEVDDTYDVPNVETVIRVTLTHEFGTRFTARIENVSEEGTLVTSAEENAPIPLSPGVWVVHEGTAPLFAAGESDRGVGLERLAEDGNHAPLAGSVSENTGVNVAISPGAWAVHGDPAPFFMEGEVDRADGLELLAETGNPAALSEFVARASMLSGGAFTVRRNAENGESGPATTGDGFTFTIAAAPDARLSLATMFGQSNDWFYAPDEGGIALWNEEGEPVSGDVTDAFHLWNAGTEVDEPPGIGLSQAPRQAAPDAGDPENGAVTRVTGEQPFPGVDETLRVTITPMTSMPFRITVRNVSDAATLTTSTGAEAIIPLSPGVWSVHGTGGRPLFTAMTVDRGAGLERIAEDGNPDVLAASLAQKIGLPAGAFRTAVGADAPAPIGPGGLFEFTIEAAPGAALSLATMFAQSNDLFFAPSAEGVPLWDVDGQPRTGDITAFFELWDAGTEVNQEPGAGPDQAPRQSAPDTGDEEDGVVRLVEDAFTYPQVEDVIEVTVEALATSRRDDAELPRSVDLYQNYPNPFNPETTISYAVDAPSRVRLIVVDALGREVATLVDDRQAAGSYSVRWDGRTLMGKDAPSGVYLYRLSVGDARRVRSMVLVR